MKNHDIIFFAVCGAERFFFFFGEYYKQDEKLII